MKSNAMKTITEKNPSRAVTPAKSETRWLLPVVNVMENRDAYLVEAEMPGVAREGLEVTLEGNTLVLTGYREVKPLSGQALYVESKPESFRRVFELDPVIDTAKIAAHLDQGLLTLTLPKAERVKPRKIVVSD